MRRRGCWIRKGGLLTGDSGGLDLTTFKKLSNLESESQRACVVFKKSRLLGIGGVDFKGLIWEMIDRNLERHCKW